ncbi:MAG: DUF3048 domain-containing protein [Chloroflexi bacterium]|nr:DUF3048 domain-containing protein [Chloroflexota bacterium]
MDKARALSLIALLVAGCASAPSIQPTPVDSPSVPPATGTPGLSTPGSSPSATVEPTPTAEPGATAYAALDGLLVDASAANRLPLAVMIDDNVLARPQSGFNAASIVYQAPADGGEDRYMLVFQERDAADVGPVRSGRPYFVYWAAEYRAGFAHYGGDEKTRLKVIPSVAGKLMYDLDALAGSSRAFHRISSRDAPHNAYTSTADLYATSARRGAPDAMVAGLATRPFKDDAPLADRPAKGSITVPYNRGATGYTYDPATNSYLRSVAGKAQNDAADGKRVVARNVVVLFMALSIDPESEAGYNRPVLAQIGKGTAWVFRDGTVVKGTWRKDDKGALTRFFDASGAEVSLNRGSIFIQVVPTGTKVTFSAPG